MADTDYKLTISDLFTDHGLSSGGVVQDVDQPDPMQVRALVASGDCFVTLATDLDILTENMKGKDTEHDRMELEKITRVLLYLQQHYEIVPKQHTHR